MHIIDLAPMEFPGIDSSKLRAVGWLERGFEYARGEVSVSFMQALARLLSSPWQPVTYAGVHRCSLCRFTGGPGQVTIGDVPVPIGVANLLVPCDDGLIYVAPSSVIHYIDAHEYAPPEVFQRAVLACPPMRSMEYLKRIKGLRPR